MNSLYSYALRLSLPVDDIIFLNDNEIRNLDVISISNDNNFGFILTVDLEIPNALHDMLHKMPVAPERIFVSRDHLSPEKIKIYDNFEDCISNPFKVEKLILNLYNKKLYTVHYKTLQTYLRLGARVSKIHSLIRFVQRPIFRDHVDFVIYERTLAKDELTKLIKKLQFNSSCDAFGRDKSKEVDVRLVINPYDANKLLRKTFFKSFTIIIKNTVLIEHVKTRIYLNRFPITASAILDLGKSHMYEIFYNCLAKNFGPRIELLMSDTDSFICFVETNNFF